MQYILFKDLFVVMICASAIYLLRARDAYDIHPSWRKDVDTDRYLNEKYPGNCYYCNRPSINHLKCLCIHFNIIIPEPFPWLSQQTVLTFTLNRKLKTFLFAFCLIDWLIDRFYLLIIWFWQYFLFCTHTHFDFRSYREIGKASCHGFGKWWRNGDPNDIYRFSSSNTYGATQTTFNWSNVRVSNHLTLFRYNLVHANVHN